MAYSTSNALSVTDLLARLRTFAEAQGWAIEFYGARTDGPGQLLTIRKGGVWFTFCAEPTINIGSQNPGPYMGVRQNTVASPVPSVWEGNAGSSLPVWSNRITSPVQTYHFFSGDGPSGPYLHVVVETDPGTFRHFGVGTLRKMGEYPGGYYCYATNWAIVDYYISDPETPYNCMPFDDYAFYGSQGATVVRADYDGATRYHYGTPNPPPAPNGRLRCGWRNSAEENGTIRLPMLCGASQQTGRAPLFPLWCAVDRGSGLWSDIGYPWDMRAVRIDNMEPGDLYPIGTDTWMVFPVARKNGSKGLTNSGVYGYAYRRA